MGETVKWWLGWSVVAAALVAAPVARGADMPQSDGAKPRRLHRHVVRPPVEVVQPSEYYERPLYQGPAFLYRPYYGSGPALQWFDFGLGRDKNGYP